MNYSIIGFGAVGRALAKAFDWSARLVIDVSNAYGAPLEQFGGLSASAVAAKSYPGTTFIAEVIEDHIREHMVDPALPKTDSRVQAAEELVDIVHSYLT